MCKEKFVVWNPDPVEQLEDGTWIFWDETWAGRCGPFKTEEIARKNLEAYAKELDRALL